MLKAPAAERNKGPILEILKRFLKSGQKVLEIASGTGQHIIHFASNFPEVCFQPSECDSRMLHSIVANIDHYEPPNVRIPLFIDVSKRLDQLALPEDFGPKDVDVIININMIHISSSNAIIGLFEVAENLLRENGGLLIIYGPFSDNGLLSPKSNIDFHASLKSQNPDWGLRDIQYIEKLATEVQLRLIEKVQMPANNLMLIFDNTQ